MNQNTTKRTDPKMGKNAVMQGNLSIKFPAKNNDKKNMRTDVINRVSINSRPSARGRSPQRPRREQINSDAFLRHLDKSSRPAIPNPKKLIKKGEEPVRIGSLMGLEEVGQCMFIEYKNDIIIIDAGMEFAGGEELGADYIIPDIAYLKKNIRKIRGIVITHGHLDHVGALRDVLPELGYPVLYTTPLALGIVKKTFDDPKEAEKIKYKIIDPNTNILKLGCFTIEFVRVNHSIPEALALSIHTPKGIIFNSGDFKVDHTPAIDEPADLGKLGRIGMEGVKLYIGDSLGASTPGRSISEKVIGETIDDIIKNTKSRMIVASFASNIGRIIQIITSAIKYNKVVFLSGRSMLNNVELCQHLGYIKVPKGYIRKLSDEAETLPDERVLILSTGAQGEEFAALTRMARGDHNIIKLRKGDTILTSSSTIPGNEVAMSKMIDNLVTKDLNVITNKDIDVHTSGHGHAEDHKLYLSLLKPEFFLPYFLNASHRYAHKKLGLDLGIPEDYILMPNENGHIIEMYDDVVLIGDKKLKLDTVLVDGKGKGHLSGEYVIKARHIMAQNGVVGLIFKIDTKTKELVGNIQIESRGFVYSSEVKNIHTQIVEFARTKYGNNLKRRKDIKENLRKIKEDLGEFMAKIIGRIPMIVPMFVYINRDPKAKNVLTKDEAILGMTLEEQGYDD